MKAKVKAKAWVMWNYISKVDGHIIKSSNSEFEGTIDQLNEETEKRTKEANEGVKAIVHQVTLLSGPSL